MLTLVIMISILILLICSALYYGNKGDEPVVTGVLIIIIGFVIVIYCSVESKKENITPLPRYKYDIFFLNSDLYIFMKDKEDLILITKNIDMTWKNDSLSVYYITKYNFWGIEMEKYNLKVENNAKQIQYRNK